MRHLKTRRLILRRWQSADIEPFAAMNADAEVMEFFPRTLSLKGSSDMVARIESSFDLDGFGLWALEIADTKQFIGFVGLNRPMFKAPFLPCIEIGWRLARQHWHKGYASEGADAAMRDGFERLNLPEIVSFTAAINTRSIRVMERLGMLRKREDDFLHPLVEDGHRLKPHVLYRLTRSNWSNSQSPDVV